jgi:hypothetical protein
VGEVREMTVWATWDVVSQCMDPTNRVMVRWMEDDKELKPTNQPSVSSHSSTSTRTPPHPKCGIMSLRRPVFLSQIYANVSSAVASDTAMIAP